MNTFFISGVQRSGTTLVSVLLSKHPDILLERRSIVFRVISCFKSMYDVMPYNLQVDNTKFLTWLIENDAHGRLAQLINTEEIDSTQNIVNLIQQSINGKLKDHGKKIWGDKSPNLEYFYNDIKLLMPKAKTLHIVRDGRAVAASMSTRSSRSLFLSAQIWVDGNIQAIVNQRIVGSESYKIIRYEDLLLDPQKTMESICKFLSIEFKPSILNPDDAEVAEKEKYVKSTFDKSKIDMWKKKLTAKQLLRIERIQGPILEKFGYQLETSKATYKHKQLSTWQRLRYKQADNFRSLFRSKRIGMVDRKNVEIKIPIKNRVYSFLKVFTQELFSVPIFKSLFPSVFYRKKRFDENEVSNSEKR